MSKGWGSEEKICSEIKSRFSTVRGTRMTMAQLRVYPDLKGHSLASTVSGASMDALLQGPGLQAK